MKGFGDRGSVEGGGLCCSETWDAGTDVARKPRVWEGGIALKPGFWGGVPVRHWGFKVGGISAVRPQFGGGCRETQVL